MQNKIVAITGGTGSFGQAFVREILAQSPKQIRVLSRDELKQSEMKEAINDPRVEYFICDVRDKERLETALEGVNVCIHAAAMKRIEKCESDPQEAVKTNVIGTMNVANACLKNNVKVAILISTDKACYPINLYGATKLTAEKIWIQSNTYRGLHHPTKFSVVRYGNVVGSRGSVLNLFKEGISKGRIKVTDQRMTRFFITLQEAVDLVEIATEMGQGGEIFVPQLKAISIYHLATLLAGSTPIEITNQRGGEKLHESLITKEEKTRMISEEHFNVINPEITTWPYHPWRSECRNWVESSEFAEKYTDDELKELLGLVNA